MPRMVLPLLLVGVMSGMMQSCQSPVSTPAQAATPPASKVSTPEAEPASEIEALEEKAPEHQHTAPSSVAALNVEPEITPAATTIETIAPELTVEELLLDEQVRIKRSSFKVARVAMSDTADTSDAAVEQEGAPVAENEAPQITLIQYRVMVEAGLEEEAGEFLRTVEHELSQPSGWMQAGYRFERVESDEDITVLLANPKTVDKLCHPMKTNGSLSCAGWRRAHLNYWRWMNGAHTWGKELKGYRSYLINHEVGHLLGMGHIGCPKPGDPAPVMLPQTKYLKRCSPNGAPTAAELVIAKRQKKWTLKKLSAKKSGAKKSGANRGVSPR